MNLNDLYKLAGISKDDTPAIEPQPVEQVDEQPMDGREDMKAMIALVTPEQLNQIVGNAPVEEEGFANSGDEYAGEPEEYNGTLGSPADLSLRRYLGANGVPVKMENVYTDHKVEDITEAWQAYKVDEKKAKPDYIDIDGDGDKEESMKKAAKDKKEKADESVEEAKVEEEPNEGNAFTGAMAGKKKGDQFKVGDKTFTKEQERLAHLAGIQVDEGMEDEEVMAIMAKHPEDVAKMKQMGDLDSGSELYMELVDYYADEMPYGTMKARDGDPVEYIMMKLDDLGMLESTDAEEAEEAEVIEDENINMLRQLAGI